MSLKDTERSDVVVNVNSIRAEMARKKVSQKKLSEILGIATSTMWLKLNWKLDFTVKELTVIAGYFNKDVNFFLNK